MTIREYLSKFRYPGRVIIAGCTRDGEPVIAYAISGRSENSRNRILIKEDGVLKTIPYDKDKIEDPSLIIYNALKEDEDFIVLSNGDHTDTIINAIERGESLSDALVKRTYEPDDPNYTPRISLLFNKKDNSYSLSIIKRGLNAEAERLIYSYEAVKEKAHIIHTYINEDTPLISFDRDPVELDIPSDISILKDETWSALDEENKISLYLRVGKEEEIINKNELNINLKYGLNPNQKKSFLTLDEKNLVKVLNGRPGYINFLDALNAYSLVRDLKEATKLPSAASFKHVSPAGCAVCTPLSDREKKMYFIKEDEALSPLAIAYVRARGADRMSSFGDFIALSDECDEITAKVIAREVSDGIIAPSYTKEALERLKKKKKGNYVILQINPDYIPKEMEKRQIYGVTFSEERNTYIPSENDFKNIVTEKKDLNEDAVRDLIVASIAAKYTQSNSVVLVKNGQTIGVGAGQQSRIHCTRLASNKADVWNLRQSEKVLSLPFLDSLSRTDKDNAIDQYLLDDPEIDVFENWRDFFKEKPEPFTKDEKKEYLKNISEVALSSDAFFPFSDNIERAYRSGVRYIAEPGGSVRDDDVIKEADKLGIVMAFTGIRLFHH